MVNDTAAPISEGRRSRPDAERHAFVHQVTTTEALAGVRDSLDKRSCVNYRYI